jgi:hypothetical protein
MVNITDITWKSNEDLIAGLLRKQIEDLKFVLRDLESGKPFNDNAYGNLKRVEQRIHWLRQCFEIHEPADSYK